MDSKAYNLILKRRTVRRFQGKNVSLTVLEKLVEAARLAPSASNLQFLEYIILRDTSICRQIFPYTRWAAYLPPEQGTPKEHERPAAYVAIICNLQKTSAPDLRDIGAAAENLILAGESFGLGSCWLGAVDKEKISAILAIPSYCRLDSLVALGYPAEFPEMVEDNTDIQYWRDKNGRHFVPKRPLKGLMHLNKYGIRN